MSALLEALSARHNLPVVGEATVDAFLAPSAGEPEHALLFFTGDPVQRTETSDVAVVLPELLTAFACRLRGAVIDRDAETALAPRFRVVIYPSLVLTRGSSPLAVLPRIKDWAEYVSTIESVLTPGTPEMPAPTPPRVEIRHVKTGNAA